MDVAILQPLPVRCPLISSHRAVSGGGKISRLGYSPSQVGVQLAVAPYLVLRASLLPPQTGVSYRVGQSLTLTQPKRPRRPPRPSPYSACVVKFPARRVWLAYMSRHRSRPSLQQAQCHAVQVDQVDRRPDAIALLLYYASFGGNNRRDVCPYQLELGQIAVVQPQLLLRHHRLGSSLEREGTALGLQGGQFILAMQRSTVQMQVEWQVRYKPK